MTDSAEYDVVIRGGTVVDGTGGPARQADVAVRGDRIAAVGDLNGNGGAARRTIDASGYLVTPGFVDIHTHLDAQFGWDPLGTSSCWHGVTSVVVGNCGVTFAPCKPEDRRYLAEMMESVEDIPADGIMNGLAWDWETYGQYLDALDALPKGVNVGGMVGHSAVRYFAMGERALGNSTPTDADIEQMAALVDEAIGAGALGFSSSRTLLHVGADGRPIPGTFASGDELQRLCAALGRHGHGVFETAACIGEQNGRGLDESLAEVAILADVSRATGRPVTFGLTHTHGAGDLYQHVLDACARHNETGANIRPQTTVRSVGILFGLAHRTPYDKTEAWAPLRDLPVEGKLAALRDPERRDELIRDGDAAPGVDPERLFVMAGDEARYDFTAEDSLAAHARRRGTSPAAAFVDIALESDGRALCNLPFLNQSLDAVADMLRHDTIVMGLGDAGAHVGQIMDASQATWFLSHWVRDSNLCGIEEGVRRLTSDTAALFGIEGRGVLTEGAFADVNIVDVDALRLPLPEFVYDLPGGAGRFVQGASGYVATLVNGEVFMEGGEHTGAIAGRMLRGG